MPYLFYDKSEYSNPIFKSLKIRKDFEKYR